MMQITDDIAPIQGLIIRGPVTLSLLKGKGLNISGASGEIAGAVFNVSAGVGLDRRTRFRHVSYNH